MSSSSTFPPAHTYSANLQTMSTLQVLARAVPFQSRLTPLFSRTTVVSRSFSTTHNMSTSNKEWLVIIADKPNSLQKRLAVRPIHLEKINPRVEVGQVVLGGAMLGEQPAVDAKPDMKGSVMIFKAETEEEVRNLVENDDYTKGDVWDVEKIQIIPFRSAFRTAM